MVHGFFELQNEEIPPRKYWHSPHHLGQWFEAVEQKRKDRSAGLVSIDDGDDNMMENELTRGLRD